MTYAGGCQCGKIRYEISSTPVMAYCCHCRDCQKQSSSAFGISVWFEAHAFRLRSGKVSTWRTTGGSGQEKSCAFCPDCGTRLYHAAADAPEMFSVKGGSLDDMHKIRPLAHIWTKSAQPWLLKLIAHETCYEIEPADFYEILNLAPIRDK